MSTVDAAPPVAGAITPEAIDAPDSAFFPRLWEA